MLCSGGGGGQRRGSAAPVAHWAAEQAVVTAPQALGLLLQLLLGCDDAGERAATLEALHQLIGARPLLSLYHPSDTAGSTAVVCCADYRLVCRNGCEDKNDCRTCMTIVYCLRVLRMALTH